MLSRAGGSSVAEIAEAFGGWEHHSCRGLISTSRRKLGWDVTTAKVAAVLPDPLPMTYRLS
jgi:hypothetical protein